MSIMDLIKKKKSMQFEVKHTGTPKVGMFGGGVQTYGGKSVGERISNIKEKFQQKKAETAILSKEKPRSGVVSVNGSVLNDRGSGARGVMKGIANKVKENLNQRSKANSASYLTSNNQQPYYLQQNKQSNNSPYYMNSNGGGGNAAWNWLTKENKEVKEKSRNIVIKIPK